MNLRKHATGVGIMNAADIVQPLLILPYAGRVLGPGPFGEFSNALSISALALVIVGYGFHWSAQREASPVRRDHAAIAALYADVVITRTVLLMIVLGAGLAAAGGPLPMSRQLFLCTMLTAAGHVLIPTWLLLALERASQAAAAMVCARILALACFLVLVRSPAQLELAVAIQTSVPLVAAIVALPFVLPVVGFDGFRSMTLSRIAGRLRSGWGGFVFSAVDSAVAVLPVPLVAYFSGYVVAAQFSVADKFMRGTRPFSRAMIEVLLPRLAYYAEHDPNAGLDLIWRSLSTLVGSAVLSLALFVAGPYVVLLVFGDGFAGAVPILRSMAILPVLININVVTSNLFMFSYGHERAWCYLNLLSLLVFLVVAYFLSSGPVSPAIGVALAVIAREGIVLVVSVTFFIKFGIRRIRLFQKQTVVGERRPASAP